MHFYNSMCMWFIYILNKRRRMHTIKKIMTRQIKPNNSANRLEIDTLEYIKNSSDNLLKSIQDVKQHITQFEIKTDLWRQHTDEWRENTNLKLRELDNRISNVGNINIKQLISYLIGLFGLLYGIFKDWIKH